MPENNQYRELFIQEAKEHVDALNENLLKLENESNCKECIHSLFRSAHTLKGMAATMDYKSIKELCQEIESVFDVLRNGSGKMSTDLANSLFSCFDVLQEMVSSDNPDFDISAQLSKLKTTFENVDADTPSQTIESDGDSLIENLLKEHQEETTSEFTDEQTESKKPEQVSTIRVKMDDLESLVNLTGELMITKMRLEQTLPKDGADESKQVLVTLNRLIKDLQSQTMKVRLVPVDQVFNRFPRVVRDVSTKLDKKVSLEMNTSGIELDRTVLDAINDPLLHIIRNSIDHGFETSEERKKLGKPEAGKLELTASRVGDKVVISVIDDGRGIDFDKVTAKAIDKGLITDEQSKSLSNEDILQLIRQPGFSTSAEVTDISGRGVGMDVVFEKIESVGGQLKISTESGKGTRMDMTLPMTMSIIGGLIVSVGAEKYVLPLSSITSTIRISPSEIETVDDKRVMTFRDEIIPVIKISDVLDVTEEADEDKKKLTIVVVTNGSKLFGLVVDSFERNQEFVIKHLDTLQNFSNQFTNTTILPDGKPALILDPAIVV